MSKRKIYVKFSCKLLKIVSNLCLLLTGRFNIIITRCDAALKNLKNNFKKVVDKTMKTL